MACCKKMEQNDIVEKCHDKSKESSCNMDEILIWHDNKNIIN
jgi:hypothetical protein